MFECSNMADIFHVKLTIIDIDIAFTTAAVERMNNPTYDFIIKV